MLIRHVKKNQLFHKINAVLTLICILVPITIFDLIFCNKISFEVTQDNLDLQRKMQKSTFLRQKTVYKSNLKPWAVCLYGSIDNYFDIYYLYHHCHMTKIDNNMSMIAHEI